MRAMLATLFFGIVASAQLPQSTLPTGTVRTEVYDAKGKLVKVEIRPASEAPKIEAPKTAGVTYGPLGGVREAKFTDGTRVIYGPLGRVRRIER